MKKANIFKIMRIDMKRAFLSYRFLFSILLGAAVCYFTLTFCGNFKSETLHMFTYMHSRSQTFLAYIAGIISYALCFYDDFLYGNIKNVLGRVRIKDYVFSKTIVAIFSTVSAFVLGKLCFVIVYSIDTPMCKPDTLNKISPSILYADLIKGGHYMSYFFFTSFHKALYCAILCQVVMFASVLIPNKAVVFCIPIAFFYIFNFYINSLIKIDFFNFSTIFDGTTGIFNNDWYGLGYACLVAFVMYWCLYRLTLYFIRKKVHYE